MIEGLSGLVVEYCPVCTLPFEYCEYGPCYKKCKVWLEKNRPELLEGGEENNTQEGEEKKDPADAAAEDVEKLTVNDGEGAQDDDDKQKKKKGGKLLAKKEDKSGGDQYIHISKAQRNKRKFITVVKGVETFGLKSKDVAQKCSKKFACSGSAGKSGDGSPEVNIQGDVMMDLPAFFVEAFSIPPNKIFFKNGAKLTKAM
eukprot:CAMPEP_0175152766 /NCGR_PEP_ID=MMETSP0087-20121206/19314_1 /TAXON_ID=136419 /ORGANISM="Unknown Unknown, Strain D1" /LENGTH=199 /DNA_ID=CAMNT_0016439271 /DNA_START=8 /DNA_END=607 /DNA_ORIENTATION=+